jgi:polysaccharide export outer membrane protein
MCLFPFRPGLVASLAFLFLLWGCQGLPPALSLAERSDAPATRLITPALIEQQRQGAAPPIGEDLRALFEMPTLPYQIGPGDVLAIIVYDHPELTGQGTAGATWDPAAQPGASHVVVGQNGQIHFPFAGAMPVAGLSDAQVAQLLTQRLARYLAQPRVSVRVHAYRSQRVYVDGEVRQPGIQAINDIPMTLMEALNRAGGMLPSADQSRLVLERNGRSVRIHLGALIGGGLDPGRLPLRSGDVLRVPSRDESKVFVSGEVLAPKALPMHDGRLTLNEALGEAGGIHPLNGDARQVYVVRRSGEHTDVFQLDARDRAALALAESFELAPKDLVYVAATPLVNWHRKLSMLFPGALTQAVTATTRP